MKILIILLLCAIGGCGFGALIHKPTGAEVHLLAIAVILTVILMAVMIFAPGAARSAMILLA